MSTERIPALLALDDNEQVLRIESDKLLQACLAHSNTAASPAYWGIVRNNLKLFKAAAGDLRVIQFRVGEPAADGSDSSTLGPYVQHNASGDLEIYASGGTGIKISSSGQVTINGTLAQPLPGLPTILTGTVTTDPPNIANGTTHTFTITVTGCSTTNTPTVLISTTLDLIGNTILWEGRVTAANTVTVKYANFILGADINLPSHTVRATVFQY